MSVEPRATSPNESRYDVASALLSLLRASGIANAPCVQQGLATPSFSDARPLSSDAFAYLVRAANPCGPAAGAGWGTSSGGAGRCASARSCTGSDDHRGGGRGR